jgi:hypothetical protein
MQVSQVACDVLGYAQGGAIMLMFKSTISLAHLAEPCFLKVFPQTWLLTMREECMLRVFENRELRRIFGPQRDEVTS